VRCLLGNPKAVAGRAFLLTGFDGITSTLRKAGWDGNLCYVVFCIYIVRFIFGHSS
jgi:hypothetical protein